MLLLKLHETNVMLILSLFCFLDPVTPFFLLREVATVSLDLDTAGKYAGAILIKAIPVLLLSSSGIRSYDNSHKASRIYKMG